MCACGHAKTRIGEAVSEKLDYVPATVRVHRNGPAEVRLPALPRRRGRSAGAAAGRREVARGRRACSRTSSSRSTSIICRSTGSNASSSASTLDLSRTTLCGWVADVATALAPIGDELRRQVTAATYLQTDDTTVTILEETGSRKGRLWTYLDPLARQVVFDATRTHERDGPEAFLAGFAGDLQADAYTGYDALYRTGRIREIGCWAHARRGALSKR